MDSWFRLKQAEVNEKARHDTKGEYTRGGQFQFTPNYDVPNYVEQARQAIGASSQLDLAVRNFDGALQTSSQQLNQYNSSLAGYTSQLTPTPNWTQVYDVFGNIKEGWTEVRNGFGHILEYTPAYSEAMKNSVQRVNQFNSQLSQSKAQLSQFGYQAQAGLQNFINNINKTKPVYDIDGNLAYGWTERDNTDHWAGRILSFDQELANAQRQALGITQTLQGVTQNMQMQQNQFQNPYQTEPQTLQNPYDDTVGTNLTNASMQLSEAAYNLAQNSAYQYQNDQLSQITDAINNLKGGNKAPININVEIGNAVTPDSESMTWLADAVSDKIAPIVENAVGNSENSY